MAQQSKMLNQMFAPTPPSVPDIFNIDKSKQKQPKQSEPKQEPIEDESQRRGGLMDKFFKKDVETEEQQPTPTMPASGSLGDMDIKTQLPKLSTDEIYRILSTKFSGSSVATPQYAQNVFNAQNSTGMSALAILGIGALESGWGKSEIAKAKGNLWGYGAVNSNPMGGAKDFSQNGAMGFANSFMKDYYNGYGAKTINMAGTGNNPAGVGYAYYDSGAINPSWASNITNIMTNLYSIAKGGK